MPARAYGVGLTVEFGFYNFSDSDLTIAGTVYPANTFTAGLDVSDFVVGFEVSDSILDDSGVVTTTGTLRLALKLADGRRLSIGSAGGARLGALRVQGHVRESLFSLKPVIRPFAFASYLEIEIGCALSLFAAKPFSERHYQPGDPDYVEPLEPLADAGNTYPYFPVDLPDSRRAAAIAGIGRDAAIAAAGKIRFGKGLYFYANGWKSTISAAYMDDYGVSGTTLLPASLTLNLGEHEIEVATPGAINPERDRPTERLEKQPEIGDRPLAELQKLPRSGLPERKIFSPADLSMKPLEPLESAPDAVTVVGSVLEERETENPSPVVSEVYDEGSNLMERTIVTVTGSGSHNVKTIKKRYLAESLMFPDKENAGATLYLAEEERSTTRYDLPGRQKQVTQKKRAARGLVLPDFYEYQTQLMDAETIITKYEYRRGATHKIETKVYQPSGAIRDYDWEEIEGGGWSPDPRVLVLGKHQIKTWQKGGGHWWEIVKTATYGLSGAAASTSVSSSNTGNTQPPAPDFAQEEEYLEEIPFSERFEEFGSSRTSGNEEIVFVAPEELAAQDIKKLEGVSNSAIAYARNIAKQISRQRRSLYEGIQITLPYSDFAGLFRLRSVIMDFAFEGETRRYVTTGHTFTHTPDSATISCVGLFVGTVAGGYLSPPWIEVVSVNTLAIPFNDPSVIDGAIAVTSPATLTQAIVGAIGQLTQPSVTVNQLVIPTVSGALWTGTGASHGIVTNLSGDTPDMVMIYSRSSGRLAFFDSLRGTEQPAYTYSTGTTESDSLTNFQADGFTLGANTGNAYVNKLGSTHVGYSFVENGAFDIVQWTGGGTSTKTIELENAPTVILFLDLTNGTSYLWTADMGNSAIADLINSTLETGSAWLNNTDPTATTLTVGSSLNTAATNYIAYCWHTETGSYVGTGSNPGAAIALTREPEQLHVLSLDTINTYSWLWLAFDSIRDPSNDRTKAAQLMRSGFPSFEDTSNYAVAWDSDSWNVVSDFDVGLNSSGITYYWWIL